MSCLYCSENGIRYMSRVILQNKEAQRRFGQPRSAAAYSKELGSMTPEARKDRWNWLMDIYKVHSGWCLKECNGMAAVTATSTVLACPE